MRRTFFGEMERRSATRDTFLPSRSHTCGMTSSANSSVICWNVLWPTIPCDQARKVSSIPMERIILDSKSPVLLPDDRDHRSEEVLQIPPRNAALLPTP